jgi:hypothetical protein
VKTFSAALSAVVLAASIGCSSSATAPSAVGSTTGGGFNVAVRPSPVTATRCSPQCPGESGASQFAFSADMTIDAQAWASVGATINSITLTATADGTTFPPLAFTADEISGQVGTNRISGHATLSFPLTIVYNTPSGNPNLSISVSVQATDDRSTAVTATGQVSVR